MDTTTSTSTKGQSLARVAIAYVVAVGAGAAWLYAGPDTAHLWLDSLIADLIGTVVIFGFSRAYRNSSFYDAYWSVVPPLFALYWWTEAGATADGTDQARVWLVLVVVWFWAIRLTGNWIYAFPGLHHEDWRYPMLRARAGKAELVADLLGIHVIPTLQVFLGMVPLYVAVTGITRDLGWLDLVAVAVGIGAVLLEWTADVQMYRFAATKQPGQVMDRGLWAWSRHPNYFGEFAFWCALGIFGFAASPDHAWWVFVGAVGMLAMFQGASIPMMEQRSIERRPAYAEVVARIPRFVPRPPRRSVA